MSRIEKESGRARVVAKVHVHVRERESGTSEAHMKRARHVSGRSLCRARARSTHRPFRNASEQAPRVLLRHAADLVASGLPPPRPPQQQLLLPLPLL
eukprot:6209578-Pleurochrysis_carterae.AAC.2